MKRQVQSLIRSVHVPFARQLPDRLGIYFHNLPRVDWPGFALMVSTLSEAGYSFGTPSELIEGQPGKVAFVSFDDNHRDWFEALPLFEDLGLSVTFFVNTAPIRDRATAEEIRSYYARIAVDPETATPLSSEEIGTIAEAGHTIGAHSHSHYVLADLADEEAKREIDVCRSLLNEMTGKPILHFSFPFGLRRHFNGSLRRYCLQSGFLSVSNAIPGMQFAGHRPSAIQRSPWDLRYPVGRNLQNLRIDGRVFERLTGRTAVAF